ncbi:MAG: TIGR00701 family protein, partial [Burkholderiales bacterium]
MYLWLKSLHVIFMVTWFAGLFYLPRLFVYHAMSTDRASIERFKIMERKLYYGITTPGGIITILLGTWLAIQFWWDPLINFAPNTLWLHTKLLL